MMSKHGRPIVGVSVGTTYLTRARVRGYLAWFSIAGSRPAFLLGDGVHAFTYAASHSVSLAKARIAALARGDELERMIRNQGFRRGVQTEVVRWNQLQLAPLYSRIVARCEALRRTDRDFADIIERQVRTALGARLAGWALSPTSRDLLERYVCHEVAGLVVLAEDLGYDVEVYPGEDLPIVRAIYRGDFPSIRRLLPTNPRREFIELRIA